MKVDWKRNEIQFSDRKEWHCFYWDRDTCRHYVKNNAGDKKYWLDEMITPQQTIEVGERRLQRNGTQVNE